MKQIYYLEKIDQMIGSVISELEASSNINVSKKE
jgi:hypothetical protein